MGQDLEKIVRSALEYQGDERLRFLETACRGDGRLRTEVESRLSEAGAPLQESPTVPLAAGKAAPGQEPAQGPRIGRVIGDFEILREIGRGGMGIVFEALQVSLNRKVALKVLPPGLGLTRAAISRFHREAQAAARLHHTNIVAVYAEGESEGTCYYAMELIRGEGLDQLINRSRRSSVRKGLEETPDNSSGDAVLSLLTREVVDSLRSGESDAGSTGDVGKTRLDFDTIAEWVACAADALEHAHSQGVIHRDVKPSNLMLAADGRIKLMDFGLARLLEEPGMTLSGEFLGTPLYMSPEQITAGRLPVDHRSDVYSLGMTLYELLTLRPAFSGTQRDEVLGSILTRDPARPRKIYRRVPLDLETICLKAIEKEPDRRYQSAGALADDLRRYRNRYAIEARRIGPVGRGIKWVRRHKLAVSAAVALFLLASIVGVMMVKFREAREEARTQEATRIRLERKAETERTLWAVQQLHAEGRYGEALDRLDSLERKELQETETLLGLETVILRARFLMALDRDDEAIEELESLLAAGADDGAIHYLLALLYQGRDPGEAAEHGRLAGDRMPATADACHLRALSTPGLNEALSWLAKGTDLDPGHYPSYKTLAVMHQARRDHAAMENAASSMILLRRDDPLGYRLRAIARREQGQFEGALRDHDRAVALAEDSGDAYPALRERLETRFQEGRFEEALADARECAAMESASPRERFQVFACLTALGHFDEARAVYDQVAALGCDAKHQFHAWASVHVFKHLGAGRQLELPAQEIGSSAYHVMLEAAGYFRQLDARADRLVPEGFTATWSPDGRELAYSRGVPGSNGIEILNLASGATRLLTVPGKDPAWSPDGRAIAFVRERERLDVAELLGDPRERYASLVDQELWIIAPDGTGATRLATGHFPSWGPDSARVYFESYELGGLSTLSIDSPGAEPELILAGTSFAKVSPDGRLAAWGADLRTVQVAEIPSGRIVATWHVPGPQGGILVHWSPDSRELSVGNFGFWRSGLWIYDVSERVGRKVLPGSATLGVWSPDRSRFAFDVRYPHYEIWVAPLDPNGSTIDSLGPGTTDKEHLEELLESWTRAIDADPGCPCLPAGSQQPVHWVYGARGRLHEELGHFSEAVADWRRALELMPDDHYLVEQLAWVELTGPAPLRDHESGLRRVLDILAPCSLHAHEGVVGAAYYRAGMLVEADEILPQTSQEARILYLRALTALDLGDALRARSAAREARALSAGGTGTTLVVSETSRELQREVTTRLESLTEVDDSSVFLTSTCAGIDRALATGDALISAGDSWRYLVGRAEPSEGLLWTQVDFDDGAWREGPSGFGYGDDDDATVIDELRNAFTTLYIRRRFEVEDPARYSSLTLMVHVDDGCVAYLNGREVGRVRAGGEGVRLTFDATASGVVDEATTARLTVDPALLHEGTNVVAIQTLNVALTSSDLTIIPEFSAVERVTGDTEGSRFTAMEESLRDRGDTKRLAYLEGRMLQLSGKHEEAARLFARAVEQGGLAAEPHLRLAECRRALGKPEEAAGTLQAAFAAGIPACRRLLGLWLEISLQDLKRPWKETYMGLPDGCVPPRSGDAANLYIAMRELVERGALRINVGGHDYRAADGRSWIGDRFFLSGRTHVFSPELTNLPDAPLYVSQRYYYPPGAGPQHYRIPLPPGSYEVSLSFCDFNTRYSKPRSRLFSVLLENERVLDDFDYAGEAGVGNLHRESFSTTVEDGHLDIEFVHGEVGSPMVSTIEIERIGALSEG